jgi:hypothetical protein
MRTMPPSTATPRQYGMYQELIPGLAAVGRSNVSEAIPIIGNRS